MKFLILFLLFSVSAFSAQIMTDLTLKEKTATGTPVAGHVKIYPKLDKKLYYLNSDGLEQEVGSGSGGVTDPLNIGTIVATASISAASFTNNDKDNFILDGGFELGIGEFACSVGTCTSETSTVAQGSKGLKIVTANQTASVTISKCNAAYAYRDIGVTAELKSDLATAQLCGWVGGANQNCVAVPSLNAWNRVPTYVTADANGCFGMNISTSGTSTGTIYADVASLSANPWVYKNLTDYGHIQYNGITTGTANTNIKFKTQAFNKGSLITVDNTTYTKVIFNKNNTSVVATVQIAPSTGSTVSPAIKVYNAADVEQTNWTGPTPSALQVGNAYTGIVQAGWYLLVKNEGAVAVFDSATQAVFSVTAQAESEHIVTPIKQNLESWYIVQNGNAFSDTTDDLRWNLAGAGTVLKNNSASTFAGLQSTSNMIYASDTGALTKFSASKPCKVIINFSATSGNTGSLFIKKNGSRVAYGSTYASGYAYLVSTTLDLNGTTDYFTLEANSLYTSAPDPTHLSILAIASDSTALGALPVDPPVAIYTTNAGQSIPNNAVTIVDFEDKIEDNYGMCTTGASFKCTAKRDGLYNICANIAFDGIQYTAGNASYIAFYKNNTLAVIPEYKVIETTVSQTRSVGGCAIIRLSVGDYLDVRTSNNRTAGATSLSTLAAFNRINITRLGN